eukprot:TRINITY_DN23515_c0_g1_i1.p1 TRINITY_DN23515_c0_g1~~TRINITY_DN23515_c0_g1_i1.p1  ORF type:complete len:141 (-),score=23.04 TRINITY_DN23515_c0_g1_i1:119-496(-)
MWNYLCALLVLALASVSWAGCDDPQDLKTFQIYYQNFTEVLQNCGSYCYATQQDCEKCLGKIGLSTTCSDCFYNYVQCSTSTCPTCLLNPTCSTCLTCSDKSCSAPLQTCAQVGSGILPPSVATC